VKSPQNSWLINPWADSLFFIAAPLAILPAYHLLSLVVSLAALKFVVLALSATGHHLPGFIRAYTDPVVFRRFRARLLLVPALIVLLTVFAVYYKLTFIFFLLVAWGTWHGILQVHGFLRIYDAKAGFHSRWMARLDLWTCLAWFVQIILWSAGKKMSLLGTFYMAGGPLFPTPLARLVETGWLAFTVGVTAAYVVVTANAALQGRFNPLKLATLVVSLAFWAYCMISVQNLIIGLLLWEIFHDLQYNAFVWSYNHGRVHRGLSQSRIERFLFRKDLRRVALYAGLILLYGCIGFLSQDMLSVYENGGAYGSVLRQIGNVFVCSALIHFYLDGFIWKMRDAKVREDMGMQAVPGGTAPEALSTGPAPRRRSGWNADARHWAFVVLVLGVSAALGLSERLRWTRGQEAGVASSLVDLVPNSGYAHFLRASDLRRQGLLDSARAHYRRAVDLDSNFAFTRSLIADLDLQLGDTAAALASYEKARAQEPGDPLIVASLADLYFATGRFAEAEGAYRTLTALDPGNPGAHYGLGFSRMKLGRGPEAKASLERSLALDPDQPAALNFLGMLEQAAGNAARARELYEASLKLDPGFAHAHRNLATLTSRLQ
jgi:tetratricopeptide (TPR) repeat protein